MTDIRNARSVIEGVSGNYRVTGKYKAKGLTSPSPTDCLVLAYASVLSCNVVTDDGGMRFLATELTIPIMGSHELLKVMLDHNKIQISDVQSAARYLDYAKDLPRAWRSESERLFGVTLP